MPVPEQKAVRVGVMNVLWDLEMEMNWAMSSGVGGMSCGTCIRPSTPACKRMSASAALVACPTARRLCLWAA